MPSQEHEDAVKALQSMPINESSTFQEIRNMYGDLLGNIKLPTDTYVETVTIAGVDAEWIRTHPVKSGRVILYLHGGGYVVGSAKMYREFGGRLSRITKAPVLVLDYRQAPENPFPAAVDDAVAGYSGLLSQGYKPHEVIFMGDSAGGGLTLATMLALKQRQLPLPRAAICMSPWTDLTLSGATCTPGAVDDPAVSVRSLTRSGRAYAQNEQRNPLASPLFGDLEGLSPLFIFVGTREMLLDDSRRFNSAARKAGVETRYFEGEGLMHCWPLTAATAPETLKIMSDIGEFCERHWRPTGAHLQS